jgi:hypothetical protein
MRKVLPTKSKLVALKRLTEPAHINPGVHDSRDYTSTVTLNTSSKAETKAISGHYNALTGFSYVNDLILIANYDHFMPYIREADIQTYILNQPLNIRKYLKSVCNNTETLKQLIMIKYSYLNQCNNESNESNESNDPRKL